MFGARSRPWVDCGIDALFSQVAAEQLVITWVSHAYYGGSELEAGYSWLSATFDGTEEVLGFIPKEGIFQFKGKVWVLLHLYPVLERDEFGLPITTVPSGFRPVDRLVLLDSKKTKLSNAVPLWLSYKVVREKTVVYRFVPL